MMLLQNSKVNVCATLLWGLCNAALGQGLLQQCAQAGLVRQGAGLAVVVGGGRYKLGQLAACKAPTPSTGEVRFFSLVKKPTQIFGRQTFGQC